MFKTTKAKVIFVTVFCSLCILVTIGAVIYKNIEIEDEKQENNQEIANENIDKVAGIDTKGTYNQNDLSILEKRATKDKIEISYCQISGLNDTSVQNNINKELESIALNCYKEEITNLDKVINVFVYMYSTANFANTLSVEVSYVAKIDDQGDGFYQGYRGINYDLNTGEKITFDKLFTANAPMEEILRKSAYYSLIKRNLDSNLSGDLFVTDYGDVEDEVAELIDNYRNNKIKEFDFSPSGINIFWNNKDLIQIKMSDYAEYVAIYNRYLNSNNIYDKNDVGFKNLYTLSDRNKSEYTYMNYQKAKNYFIDVNLMSGDSDDNIFSENLKNEKISEIEQEIEKIKNLVYKNSDNFYILNYNIYISTTYDNQLMQNITTCEIRGNLYEMTVHDFEENIEQIIIKANRGKSEASIDDYIYDFSDVLKIDPQASREYYNPETGEKIVI